MKNILLINPEETKSKFNFLGITEDEPIDIEVIYTILKKEKYNVNIFDPDRDKNTVTEIAKDGVPDFVYILGGVKQSEYILDYAYFFSQRGSKIIIGGVYAEYNFQKFYTNYIDYVLRTFDPAAVLEIISGKQLSEINGLCYKHNNKWIENAVKPFDINKLPGIDRSHFYKYKESFCFFGVNGVANVRSAYSCPNNCAFCYRTLANQGTYTVKDIGKFVEEIEKIEAENINIVDDNFLVNKNRIEEFIKLINKKGIKKTFICFGRVDFIVNNKETMQRLYDIGFRYIMLGLEATDDSLLEKYNKKTSVNENKDCVNFLNETGFTPIGMFIVDIDFKKNNFINLYNWSKDNNLIYSILSIYTPMPGTKPFEMYKNKFLTNDTKKWDFTHLVITPTYMSVKRFYLNYYILSLKLLVLGKKRGGYKFINFRKKAIAFLFTRSRK